MNILLIILFKLKEHTTLINPQLPPITRMGRMEEYLFTIENYKRQRIDRNAGKLGDYIF